MAAHSFQLALLVAASLLSASCAVTVATASAGSAAADGARGSSEGVRTITKVVKMLQTMLDDSKTSMETDRQLYGKYKCYCDDTRAENEATIAAKTEEIEMLSGRIEELKASSAILSKEIAALKKDIETWEQMKLDATAQREEENAAYLALKADLEAAIDQMTQAIEVLSEVGGDQTKESSQSDFDVIVKKYNDFNKSKAGPLRSLPTLLKLQSTVQQALVVANALKLDKEKAAKVQAFLQQPTFTGVYSSQSGQVVGILKDMKDRFNATLEEATEEENARQKAYEETMATLQSQIDVATLSKGKKEAELAANDQELAAKEIALAAAKQLKADTEAALALLNTNCATKAEEYETRNLMRSKEQAAIAEAISILNSDAAFGTFGKVTATSTGSATVLLQRSAIRRHVQRGAAAAGESARRRATALLRSAASSERSPRLGRIAAMLQAVKNPFETVLTEIEKMTEVLTKEGEADQAKLDWCTTERTNTQAVIDQKTQLIAQLEQTISELKGQITQLENDIATNEELLTENRKNQAESTATRKEENVAYQTDISHLVEAQSLLKKATTVLKRYYESIAPAAAAELQMKQAPTVTNAPPPETWENEAESSEATKYTSELDSQNSVITLLESIIAETEQEEETAHSDELSAQHAFEDEMTTLKTDESSLVELLTNLNAALAESKETLAQKQEEKTTAEADKAAAEAYLLQIKPGCDFITDNIETRNTHRQTETKALRSAVNLLKKSPAYLKALEAAKVEGFGDCKMLCEGGLNEESAACKACLAKVSVPGYCASHPGTPGC